MFEGDGSAGGGGAGEVSLRLVRSVSVWVVHVVQVLCLVQTTC